MVFKYNPYPLPVIGLIAVLLYLGFFLTNPIFIKWAKYFYAKSRNLSIFVFTSIFLIIAVVLGMAGWFAINKSKEHISALIPNSGSIAKTEPLKSSTPNGAATEITKRELNKEFAKKDGQSEPQSPTVLSKESKPTEEAILRFAFWPPGISSRFPIYLIDLPLVVKRGGHPDQLSRATPALDRYRIQALVKLLDSGRLTAGQYESAFKELKNKCRIYGQGV